LLMHPEAIDSPFFKLVPSILLYPMIALATAAAVIASQAVISGAFSMTREAMSLGYSMRMPIVHTSREMSGQIFVPWVNNFLLLMVLFAVLHFGSSEKLSAAYGIAVTGTMSITTVLALVVARRQWHWKLPAVIAAGVLFLVIDLSSWPRAGGARDQAGRPGAGAVHRGDARAPAAARAGHGGVPHREPECGAACAAAQPQAQQGAA